MQKRTLISITVVLALLGTGVLVMILGASLQPDPPARGQLPEVKLSGLLPGHVAMIDTDSLRYFVVRPVQGEIHAVAVPLDNGTVLMPEKFWWKPKMNCKDFGTDSDAVISDTTYFRCRDADQPTEWMARWRWDLNGINAPENGAERVDDMYRVRLVQEDDTLKFAGLITN